MSRSCRTVEALIGRPPGSLRDAERLVLEQHLAECGTCRHASDLAGAVGTMVRQATSALSETARERVLSAAFANVGRPAQAPSRRSHKTTIVLACVAAAAVVVLTMHLSTSDRLALDRREPAPAPRGPTAEPVNEPAAATVADVGWFEARQPEMHRFAHAQVELERGTRVQFIAASRTLELATGRISVDVDASRGLSFEVRTQLFVAQALGTSFSVSPERVDVHHGRVRVRNLAGKVLAELTAGGSFAYVQPQAAPAHAAFKPEPQGSASVWLDRARAELARGNGVRARELLSRAERSAVTRTDKAEAGTLAAECALVERDPSAAVRAYERVAARFRDLPAGENALFAAAQMSLRAHNQTTAKRLLSLYLTRYPHGRFADETRVHLKKAQALTGEAASSEP